MNTPYAITKFSSTIINEEYGYSRIHWASYFDDVDVFLECLESSECLLYSTSKRGNTCLHIAAATNSVRILRCILSLSNPVNLEVKNDWSETPLHVCVAAGNCDVFSILVEAGASIDTTDKWNRNAYAVAKEQGCQEIISLVGDYYRKVDKILFEKTEVLFAEKLKNQLQKEETSPITYHHLQHNQLLQEISRKINNQELILNKNGHTISTSERHIFNDLITQFKNPNKSSINNTEKDDNYDSSNIESTNNLPTPPYQNNITHIPSSAAAPKKSKTIPLSKVVEFPGDPDRLRSMVVSPDEYELSGKDMFGWTALHKFAAWDKVDLLEVLLPALSPAEVNIQGGPMGFTCLHSCVDAGARRALRYLISQSCVDPHLVDKNGRTAETLAREIGLIDLAHLLRECTHQL